jgi:hypothetical protein
MEGGQYGLFDSLTVNSGHHSHGCIHERFNGFFSGFSRSHGYINDCSDSSRAADVSLKQSMGGAMKRSKVNSSKYPNGGKMI